MQSEYPEGKYWTDACSGTYTWNGGTGNNGEIARMGAGSVRFCFHLSGAWHFYNIRRETRRHPRDGNRHPKGQSDQMFYNCRIPSFSFRTGCAQSALLPSRRAR
ncbi:hypothetical protein M9Y10_036411 [Tritrichomonas musculus]|uniref:Uncharacterized protein n=1 Tax=Tritrichomonas musculus TaxID=1915356 RepID=A0ABR2GU66_9EUKA